MFYKFQRGLSNESYYGEFARHLVVRSGEHIGNLPLSNERVEPGKERLVCHHLSHCNYLPMFEGFGVLCRGNKKYLLELKEGTVTMKGRPSMNHNIRSALYISLNEFYHAACFTLWNSAIYFLSYLRNFLDLRINCKF